MLEPIEHQYFLIGQIAHSRGLDGQVLVVPEIDDSTLFDEVELVHLQNNRGDLIPARIESFRVQQKNNRLSFFVKFEHITDRNKAEKIKNYPVYIAKYKVLHLFQKDSGSSWKSYSVMNENQSQIGVVVETIDNPAHPILSVEMEDGSMLIPFVDEYIQITDEENEIIYCKNLHQLKKISDDAN